MAQQTINTGTAPNDGTGDTLRDAMTKANANFTELYGLFSSSSAYVPTLLDSGGGRTFTASNSGSYAKNNKLVALTASASVSAASGTASGALRISLPFACASKTAFQVFGDNLALPSNVLQVSSASSVASPLMAVAPAGQSYVEIFKLNEGEAENVTQSVQATSTITISGIFITS